ncbi:two-component sensor histidine kinase [Actinoplanes ianthinogenes]|uniref:histidine kinase n=1 Tax=Actinoplanes ianthinogenes TaxID=122358 RepID=A0ABM7LJR0_9ACTN|nr:histidine kinase [Actinoplanes ianthinogenes]BCJ39491.1 two-component sensor histidine kinase [Actinoplanes ianthinogenes]GGR35715.1 two-component sensor histidine kinase [Actinoplanes ianthinogenes]
MSPRKVDAGIAALAALACGLILTGRTGATVGPTGPPDWALAVLLPVPLVWRRQAPVPVFALVTVAFWVSQAAGLQAPAGLLVVLLALHAVARHRPATYTWPAVAVTLLPGLAQPNWAAVVAVGALVVATALIGISQRTRAAYLASLEDRARLAVTEERARIAREMHDVVAHHIAVMIALSDGAAAVAGTAPDRAAEVMSQASATGRQALGDMRRLVGLLRDLSGTPSDRAPQPGVDDLDALLDRVRAAGLRVSLTREGTPGAGNAGAGLAIYRIVQEALTNTLKHAGPAARAEVTVRYHARGADVTVLDDGAGRGARPAAAGERHGLAGMLERAALHGGTVAAGPLPGAGWRVHATLRSEPVR